MKTTILNVLTSSAMFSALSSSVLACGGYSTSNHSYNSFPVQRPVQTVQTRPIQTIANPLTSVAATTPVAPAARISVVPAVDNAPVGNIQLASAVTETKPTVSEVPAKVVAPKVEPADSKEESEISKKIDALKSDEPAKEDKEVKEDSISDALKGLVGTWLAVSKQGEGELSTVELQLDDHGWGKLTVPGSDGKPSTTTTRKVELENNELKLTGGAKDITLGKLVSSDARQMVLDRSGSQVTFVRP